MAEPAYYEEIQKFLDARPLVLYEGVGASAPTDTAAERIEHSKTSVMFIRALADRYHRSFGRYPESIDRLRKTVGSRRKDLTMHMRMAVVDGWRRPVEYWLSEDKLSVLSMGADGRLGGEGENADIELSDPIKDEHIDTLTDPKDSPVHGLAHSMKLIYQREGINYDRDNFVNCDVSAKWLRKQVGDNPAMKNVEAMLGGGGLRAFLARLFVGMVKISPKFASMVKFMMIETLSQLRGAPRVDDDTDRLMEVILDRRNEVVTAEMKRICEMKQPPGSVAVFYGAAHMPQIEQHLVEKLGYRRDAVQWLTAFGIDTKKEGLSPAMVATIRRSLRGRLQKMRQPASRPAGS
jgi:hypothetical protein